MTIDQSGRIEETNHATVIALADKNKGYTLKITPSVKRDLLSTDEELALHIFHKFNIDRDTMESMPAFEENIKPLFGKEK